MDVSVASELFWVPIGQIVVLSISQLTMLYSKPNLRFQLCELTADPLAIARSPFEHSFTL